MYYYCIVGTNTFTQARNKKEAIKYFNDNALGSCNWNNVRKITSIGNFLFEDWKNL